MSETTYSHTFPNGLVLVAEPMRSLESAAFTLAVPAGCIYDPEDRAGLAGFTCELALRGCGDKDSREFIIALENLGVDRGESVTSAHTYYSGATLADNLLPALDIYADLVRRPHLPEELIEAGRQVMLHELYALEDDPSQKTLAELRRRHYPEPWGRSSEGTLAGIEATEIEDVRRHFQQTYKPNGCILSVAGRIDWQQLKDHVEQHFGDWQGASPNIPAEGARGPRVEHLLQETNQTQIGIAYDSAAYRDKDYFQAWGAVGILSSGMSSRLFTEVRERRGLCYSVYASTHSLKDRGSVICYSGTSSDRAQQTLDCILAELKKLAEGVYEDELARLKARMKSALIMQQESSSARASSMARDWYHLGQVRTLDEIGDLVDGLTAESISHYLKEHPPHDFTVVTLGPQALEVQVEVP